MGLSQRFDATEAWWKALPQRQRIPLAFLLSWLCIFILDQIGAATLQYLPGAQVLLSFFSALRPILFNQITIGIVVGALLVGFWPNVANGVWKARGCLFGIIVGFGGIYLIGYIFFGRYAVTHLFDPSSYSPPIRALIDDAGKPRKFTSHRLTEIRMIYDSETQLAASTILHDDIGKWIVVSGKLEEISPEYDPKDSFDMKFLQISADQTILNFPGKWKDRLSKLKVRSRIHALCVFQGGREYLVDLGDCRLL